MPTFTYRARGATGQLIEGSMEADSQRLVIAQLRDRGLMTTDLREEIDAPSVGEQVGRLGGVGREALVLFTRQLATMVSGGLALLSALDIAARQTESNRLRDTINEIHGGIRAGGTLSGEMEKHPRVFSELYVNTVRAGEVSGALDRVLVYLANYLERELELLGRIKTAATYPSIVLGVAMLVGILAVFVILPSFVALFAGLQVSLPLPTQILIGVSRLASRFWYVVFGLPVVAAITMGLLLRRPDGRAFLDRVVLRIPIIGALTLKIVLSRLARMFAVIVRSGVPQVQGMQTVARSVGNAVVASAVDGAARSVREGQPIAESLAKYPIIPPMISQMVAVGEETGALEEILDKVADFYEREVNNTVDRFASIIEPVLLISVGAVVAFVAIALLLPVWRLIGAIR
ncbi:MAG TPA: type II secretion system F family protein [bacterium]|jgi:type IV pilus assembly protein PilC